LVRRLESEPGITEVVLSSQRPGFAHSTSIELAPRRPGGASARAEAEFIQAEPGFFGLFDIPVLAGRTFQNEDAPGTATAVVVNRSFVNRVLGGEEALGRRIRYAAGQPAPLGLPMGGWYEIVGVVEDYPVE